MAKASLNKTKKKRISKINLTLTSSQRLVMGSFLIIIGILLFTALLSYLFTGDNDQSVLGEFTNRAILTENWLSKIGAWISELLIYQGFGISSFIFSGLILLSGISVLANSSKKRLWRNWFWGTLIIIWGSILFGFIFQSAPDLGGSIGYELNLFFQDYIGKTGTALLMVFGFITYIAIRFKVTPKQIGDLFIRTKNEPKSEFLNDKSSLENVVDNSFTEEANSIKSTFEIPLENIEPTISNHSSIDSETIVITSKTIKEIVNPIEDSVEMEIEINKEEVSETDNLAAKLVEDFGEVDPTLELSKFQFPPLDILKKYDTEGITINQEELEENKNKIVETLNNYKIAVSYTHLRAHET